jgi:hypothetical protein
MNRAPGAQRLLVQLPAAAVEHDFPRPQFHPAAHRHWPGMRRKRLLVLVPYCAFRVLGEALGEGRLARMFFVEREPMARR